MADNREELYRITQNDTNFMLISKSEFKDKEYYDVRKYFINDKGQEIATKKGLTLTAEEWEKVCTLMLDFINFESESKSQSIANDFQSQEPNLGALNFQAINQDVLDDYPFGVANNDIFNSDSEIPF